MKQLIILMLFVGSSIPIFAQSGGHLKYKNIPVDTAKTYYTCSMHPEVRSSKPGKCPKCGMELVKVEQAIYACPMHPEVISKKPGKCHICGMTLEKKNENVIHKMK